MSPPTPEHRAGYGLRLALTTFTVLPVNAPTTDRRTAAAAMLWAPGVGAGLGGLLALGCVGAGHVFPRGPGQLLTAVLAVLLAALLSRGLHLDGLADTVDGLGCYGDQEQALSVMRSPEVGPFGVAAVVLVLLVDIAALLVCLDAGRATAALVIALATGRLAVTWSCTPRTPAARPTGLGALVAGTTSARTTAALTVGIACAGALLGLISGDHASEDAGRALAAVLLPLAAVHALRSHAVHRFGGITGDVLGAVVEVSTAVSLVVMAVGVG